MRNAAFHDSGRSQDRTGAARLGPARLAVHSPGRARTCSVLPGRSGRRASRASSPVHSASRTPISDHPSIEGEPVERGAFRPGQVIGMGNDVEGVRSYSVFFTAGTSSDIRTAWTINARSDEKSCNIGFGRFRRGGSRRCLAHREWMREIHVRSRISRRASVRPRHMKFRDIE